MQGIRVQTGIHDSHRKFRMTQKSGIKQEFFGTVRKYGLKQAIGPMGGSRLRPGIMDIE
jgi:hypothetical protein